MKTRVLHYAAGGDALVGAPKNEGTHNGKQLGGFLVVKNQGQEKFGKKAHVERIDGICFVAEFPSRNSAFDKEHLAADEAEARNLRAAMQERIA